MKKDLTVFDGTKQSNVLKLFNVMVIDSNTVRGVDTTESIKYGVVTDFQLEPSHVAAIRMNYQPIPVKTMFGKVERDTAPLAHLLVKQILHYIEIYGFDSPGLFDLETTDGHITVMRRVKGVTVAELTVMVQNLIYANAPIKDVAAVIQIINDFDIHYDLKKVANNELRITAFRPSVDTFTNGDDAARWICYKATNNTLLIKSEKVIKQIEACSFSSDFFEYHKVVLAQVFNRHKRIILAAKNSENRSIINKISKMSKTRHVPLLESLNKRIMSIALRGEASLELINKVGLRDKFKVLNLLEYKRNQFSMDTFIIRNGKVHLEMNREIFSIEQINAAQKLFLDSIAIDLKHLKGKNILLDASVDYGLPISRKQSMGNLPFGTEISVSGGPISSGIYWENEWGARDLDLSAIDENGNRTGWGGYNGYSKSNKITFSGDITDASDGAMEFTTSSGINYGLFVNIYYGDDNAKFELVVGSATKEKWITDTIIREKHTLTGKGSIIGFVKNNKYVVYCGQLNQGRVSNNDKSRAVISRGSGGNWTVSKLFDALNINYTLDSRTDVCYDHNMNYGSFSYDKLEKLFFN